MPPGRNSHDSVSSVPPSTGVKTYPHRVQEPFTMNANSRPRSAATISDRVSQVRSGSSFRPVNQAPTSGGTFVPPAGLTDRTPCPHASDIGDQVVEVLRRASNHD